ncbi:MAG: HU family DNA-binding protein [Clostridia bacterium]|nr:HU family DNA-binding protein [Clostridia bacterium]
MTKTELIAIIAKEADLPKAKAEKALAATLDGIKKALKKGDKVQFVGFGTFEVRKRPARKGLNPRTKEAIKIPACKAPAFKAGKALKEAVK